MIARPATENEIAHWDDLIVANPDGGNIFSSQEYLEQKRLTNYTPHHFMVDGYAVSVLEKQTFPLGRLWYLPKGPNTTDVATTLAIIDALKQIALKRGVFAIRLETELPVTVEPELQHHGLVKAAAIIPNPSTITLSITAEKDELLMNLPQKGRHAIRRAERDGVTVEAVPSTDENCRIMYDLLAETAKGQFGIRSYAYFEAFWKRFERAQLGQLFFAYYEGAVVAGAYALIFGHKSTYKDGASVRERTAYGASHLLQWNVIAWAKERGAQVHDFCGSPPSHRIEDTSHPHYGVGRFKLSFSRDIHDYIGCYDVVLRPRRYNVWIKIGERIARKIYYTRTHDYYY